MGGSNASDNLVLLTPKEHFVCHHLLFLFVRGPDKHKMAFAWNMMCWGCGKNKDRPLYFNSRLFAVAKAQFATSIGIINSKPNLKLQIYKRNLSKYGNVNHLFFNVDTGQHVFGSSFDLLDLDKSLCLTEISRIVDNSTLSSKGWMVQLEQALPTRLKQLKGEHHHRADKSIFDFIDTRTGNKFQCNRHEIKDHITDREFTSQGITDMIKGRQKSHRDVMIVHSIQQAPIVEAHIPVS
jgi:hypothetical protein